MLLKALLIILNGVENSPNTTWTNISYRIAGNIENSRKKNKVSCLSNDFSFQLISVLPVVYYTYPSNTSSRQYWYQLKIEDGCLPVLYSWLRIVCCTLSIFSVFFSKLVLHFSHNVILYWKLETRPVFLVKQPWWHLDLKILKEETWCNPIMTLEMMHALFTWFTGQKGLA